MRQLRLSDPPLEVKVRAPADPKALDLALSTLEGVRARREDDGWIVLAGDSEAGLDAVIDPLATSLELEVGAPQVAFRETVTRTAEAHREFKKHGGLGRFADLTLEVAPAPSFDFKDRSGRSLPDRLLKVVRDAIDVDLEKGPVGGFPVVGLRVALLQARSHPIDSDPFTFTLTTRRVLRDAIRDAKPVILEPLARLDLNVPQAQAADVLADLKTRRARVEKKDGGHLRALVPYGNIFGYRAALAGMTGGTGTFIRSYAHHAPLPIHVAPIGRPPGA
ncbi:hypothetical protein [Pontivivens ytuae]|uniref:Elongation factor G n=1 Tax=Pontivivens ytuae TaxID=2789856 RepID=A0A7S9LTH8_9RHOB|nr:hypothetical protein [Pontivivens ytuae]QPH55022.1 hypothetical protein I0K15_04530 [Pontivivens ytuae]